MKNTVRDIIEQLEKLDSELPCFVRPKYHGTLEGYQETEVLPQSISEMVDDNDKIDRVVFLV